MGETEWATIISDCRSSNISARAWCKKNGYKYTAYCYWNKKLSKQKQQWVQIVSGSETIIKDEISLQCGKWTITVNEGFSPKLFGDVLQVVNSICY